jgi:guanylate kinase
MNEGLALKLQAYQPNRAAVKLIKATPILLLVGPTGAGKDTLKDKLLAAGGYHHIVSHTTRPPRINHGTLEQDGREYHFIDMAQAEQMVAEQAFVEAKFYSGNLYGTSISEIQKAHDESKIALTDLEVQGVAEYKALDPGVMAVFLLPPDFKTWQRRLMRRYGDVVDAGDHRLRLQTALQELEQLLNTDYYVGIVNDNLQATFDEVQSYAHHGDRELKHEAAAHEVAQKLAADIQEYLDSQKG